MVDTSPAAIGGIFDKFMTGSIGNLVVDVAVWLMIIAFIGLIAFLFYMFITYKYKAIVFKAYGDGKGGIGVGKPRFDFARIQKDKSWRWVKKKRVTDPVEAKHLYPGNWIIMYEVGGEYIPGKVNIGEQKDLILEPVPYAVRKKVELELQQLEQDFSKIDAWEANKIFIYTLIGAGMVIVLAGFVLWLAFKKTDQIVPALSSFSNSLSNMGNIPGKG